MEGKWKRLTIEKNMKINCNNCSRCFSFLKGKKETKGIYRGWILFTCPKCGSKNYYQTIWSWDEEYN